MFTALLVSLLGLSGLTLARVERERAAYSTGIMLLGSPGHGTVRATQVSEPSTHAGLISLVLIGAGVQMRRKRKAA